MIKTVTFSEFCDSFSDTYKHNFSYAGKRALFDYFEQLEEDTGEQIELDPVALCCEYSEYENLRGLQASYSNIQSVEQLKEKTIVIPIEGSEGFIIQNF